MSGGPARAEGLARPRSRSLSGNVKAGMTDRRDRCGLEPRSRWMQTLAWASSQQVAAGLREQGGRGLCKPWPQCAAASLLCPLLVQAVTKVGPGVKERGPLSHP